MNRLAIIRAVSPRIGACELTHLDRQPIDAIRAATQHDAYRQALIEQGWAVFELPASADHPDCVFVEDTAVMLSEAAILCRPGAESRRGEVAAIEPAISRFRTTHSITHPGTVDGGDVLVVGRDIFVGLTNRTNHAGIEQLASHVEPLGYRVRAINVGGCLHLKTACCAVGAGHLLANPDWVDVADLDVNHNVVTVDPSEPFAANVLDLDDIILVPEHHPKMAAALQTHGHDVRTIPADELAKAEGGLTCGSLLVRGW